MIENTLCMHLNCSINGESNFQVHAKISECRKQKIAKLRFKLALIPKHEDLTSFFITSVLHKFFECEDN